MRPVKHERQYPLLLPHCPGCLRLIRRLFHSPGYVSICGGTYTHEALLQVYYTNLSKTVFQHTQIYVLTDFIVIQILVPFQ